MQQLWLAGIGWDDPIPAELNAEWVNFKLQLPLMNCIKINRSIELLCLELLMKQIAEKPVFDTVASSSMEIAASIPNVFK